MFALWELLGAAGKEGGESMFSPSTHRRDVNEIGCTRWFGGLLCVCLFFFIIISPLKQIIGPIVSVSFESRNIPEQLPVGREKYEGNGLQIAGIDEKILKRN